MIMNSMALNYCTKAGANPFSLQSKLLHGKKMKSDHKINILVPSPKGNIVEWVARVEFL